MTPFNLIDQLQRLRAGEVEAAERISEWYIARNTCGGFADRLRRAAIAQALAALRTNIVSANDAEQFIREFVRAAFRCLPRKCWNQ